MFKLIGSYTDESGGTAYDQSIARIDPLIAGDHVSRFVAVHDYVILNSGLSPSSAVITNVELCVVEKPMSSGNPAATLLAAVISEENDTSDEQFEANAD